MIYMVGSAGATVTARLFERVEQLSALRDCLAAVRKRSRGQMILLRGEAGIGKTALLQSFCGELGPSVRVLWADCERLLAPRPLGAFLDLADDVGGGLSEAVVAGAKPHAVASALVGELADRGPSSVVVLEDVQMG
jgi:predicted ATPase